MPCIVFDTNPASGRPVTMPLNPMCLSAGVRRQAAASVLMDAFQRSEVDRVVESAASPRTAGAVIDAWERYVFRVYVRMGRAVTALPEWHVEKDRRATSNRLAITDAKPDRRAYTKSALMQQLDVASRHGIDGLVSSGALPPPDADGRGTHYWLKSEIDPRRADIRAIARKHHHRAGVDLRTKEADEGPRL